MHQARTASATSPSSATAAVGRPRCTRRCCSRPAPSAGSARWPTARRSPTPTPTSRRARCRSRRRSSSFEWQDRKINLLDTPGEPSFVADALGALRVCESAVFVVNARHGRRGVDTMRLWERAAELDIARLVFVNMLDRERADFFRTLDGAQGGVRPARRRDRDPDRRRARGPRRHRPRRHEGLRVRPAGAGRDNCTRDPDPRRARRRRPRSTARS